VQISHGRIPIALLWKSRSECVKKTMLGYLAAGSDGSLLRGHRRCNWVWYRSLTHEQLRAVLTSDAGELRHYSALLEALSHATREELVQSAMAQLPAVLAKIVEREPNPFIQAIFDYEEPSMVRERVALLGDAAFIVRPHTAMRVSKAACDAMTLRHSLNKKKLSLFSASTIRSASISGWSRNCPT
jgi:2-polyprenyl-6-methoxyphenol hydroxylase-like FAD-dependent oxidoreductase